MTDYYSGTQGPLLLLGVRLYYGLVLAENIEREVWYLIGAGVPPYSDEELFLQLSSLSFQQEAEYERTWKIGPFFHIYQCLFRLHGSLSSHRLNCHEQRLD